MCPSNNTGSKCFTELITALCQIQELLTLGGMQHDYIIEYLLIVVSCIKQGVRQVVTDRVYVKMYSKTGS